MTDFIREVDEEVRQDRLKRLFQRYWIVGAVLAVLVLAGVAAWQAYDYLSGEKRQAAGGRYLAALDLARDGKSDEATAALKGVADDATGGYRVLARMRLAAEIGAKDGSAGAMSFDAIAADAAIDPALRDVARVRAAMLLLDSTAYPDLKARIEPLTDANNPVRNTARELLALAALKADMNEEAGRFLDAIETDPTTNAQLRQRVEALQGLVRGTARPAEATGVPSPPPASTEVETPPRPAAK